MNRKGFSLLEVLIAATVLSLGTMLLQESLLRSAALFGRYGGTLGARVVAEQKVWAAREDILSSTQPGLATSLDRTEIGGREFRSETNIRPAPGKRTYGVLVTVSWEEAGHPRNLRRETYVFHPKTDPSLPD